MYSCHSLFPHPGMPYCDPSPYIYDQTSVFKILFSKSSCQTKVYSSYSLGLLFGQKLTDGAGVGSGAAPPSIRTLSYKTPLGLYAVARLL